MYLFECGIHEVQHFCHLGRDLLHCLLKQLARTLNLLAALMYITASELREKTPREESLTYVALDKLGEVCVPHFEDNRPLEQPNALLVCTKGFLKVVVLLEKQSIVDDNLQTQTHISIAS